MKTVKLAISTLAAVALLTIEPVYAGDEKAEQARSTFTAEDHKTLRGEPHERTMAFYHRGTHYLAAVAQTGVGGGIAGMGAGTTAVGGFVTLISGAVAQATKPEADIRQWDNLPESTL